MEIIDKGLYFKVFQARAKQYDSITGQHYFEEYVKIIQFPLVLTGLGFLKKSVVLMRTVSLNSDCALN